MSVKGVAPKNHAIPTLPFKTATRGETPKQITSKRMSGQKSCHILSIV